MCACVGTFDSRCNRLFVCYCMCLYICVLECMYVERKEREKERKKEKRMEERKIQQNANIAEKFINYIKRNTYTIYYYVCERVFAKYKYTRVCAYEWMNGWKEGRKCFI